MMLSGVSMDCQFQSTRPVRGATYLTVFAIKICLNFNPRAPCGARLNQLLSPLKSS